MRLRNKDQGLYMIRVLLGRGMSFQEKGCPGTDRTLAEPGDPVLFQHILSNDF